MCTTYNKYVGKEWILCMSCTYICFLKLHVLCTFLWIKWPTRLLHRGLNWIQKVQHTRMFWGIFHHLFVRTWNIPLFLLIFRLQMTQCVLQKEKLISHCIQCWAIFIQKWYRMHSAFPLHFAYSSSSEVQPLKLHLQCLFLKLYLCSWSQ